MDHEHNRNNRKLRLSFRRARDPRDRRTWAIHGGRFSENEGNIFSPLRGANFPNFRKGENGCFRTATLFDIVDRNNREAPPFAGMTGRPNRALALSAGAAYRPRHCLPGGLVPDTRSGSSSAW